MADELDVLLGNMHSDENRLIFLRKMYTPGNTEIADRILAMSDDSSVIEEEIKCAKTSGDKDRFGSMARKLVDYHVSNGFDILLKDIVIGWGNPKLADYAIAQMNSKFKANRKLACPLEYSAEIALAFGKEDVAKANLERLLALQLRESKYKFPAAATLKKLGRFDEAIDKYSACEYGWLSNALSLAKEHSPNRVTEIAQKGFKSFDTKTCLHSEFYVECARVLGKESEAASTLVKYAEKTKIEGSPRFYHSIVNSLISLGKEGVARELVKRVARYEKQAESESVYTFDRSEEMAQLYHAIGEIDVVKAIYVERIEAGIRNGHHPSNVMNDITKAIELTGHKTFFTEKRLLLHEKLGEYEEASKLAAELGKTEIAESYGAIHKMIQLVKAQRSESK